MMKLFRTRLAASALGAACLLAGCSSAGPAATPTPTPDAAPTLETGQITCQELALDGSVQIIDLRETSQYIGWANEDGAGGHIPGAMDFPLSWLTMSPDDYAFSSSVENELTRRGIDKTKPTVIYDNGTVSDTAVAALQSAGFTDLTILDGGFNAWCEMEGEIDALPGYQRYVPTWWVQELVEGGTPEGYSGGDYVIVEITLASEAENYSAGHIPGAIQIPADDFNHVPGLRVLAEYEGVPMEEQLTFWDFYPDDVIQSKLEAAGITTDTTVILYGSYAATTAANRAALVMDYAGVQDIRLINGGKYLWELEDRPLESGTVEPSPVDSFGATVPQNPDLYIDYEEEVALTQDPGAVIASIRSWPEYLGEISGYTYIGEAGDIANARFGYGGSDPYAMEDFRNVDNTMFNYELCAQRWEKWGITPDKMVSFHCGTGWRASETYYIAEAMGWENIGVYVGGWYQWSKMPDSQDKPLGLPQDAPEQSPQEFFLTES